MIRLSMKHHQNHFKMLCSVFFIIMLSGCNNFTFLPKEEKAQPIDKNAVKNGLVTSKHKNGNTRTEIIYKDGVKDGLAKSYYLNGNIKNEIFYKKGIKEGVAKLYYEKGGLNRETEYVNGIRHGTVKKYYMNGQLSSVVSYFEGMMGNDLVEYRKSGEKRKSYPQLRIYAEDKIAATGEYIIKVTFSKDPKRADYFLGELVDGKYFDKRSVLELSEREGIGYYVLKPPPGMFTMQKLTFIGKLKTRKGNYLIRSKVFNLAIEG